MKKFSQIQKDKKIIEPINKIDGVESDIEGIVEDTLNVVVDGDIDDYLSENIGIDGKDKLIKELVKYINRSNIKREKEVLEKVVYQGLESVILESQTVGKLKKHKERILSLLEKGNMEKRARQQAKSIKNGEKAYYRGMAAEQMMVDQPEKKKDLKKIKDIFVFRSKQLGYRS